MLRKARGKLLRPTDSLDTMGGFQEAAGCCYHDESILFCAVVDTGHRRPLSSHMLQTKIETKDSDTVAAELGDAEAGYHRSRRAGAA